MSSHLRPLICQSKRQHLNSRYLLTAWNSRKTNNAIFYKILKRRTIAYRFNSNLLILRLVFVSIDHIIEASIFLFVFSNILNAYNLFEQSLHLVEALELKDYKKLFVLVYIHFFLAPTKLTRFPKFMMYLVRLTPQS